MSQTILNRIATAAFVAGLTAVTTSSIANEKATANAPKVTAAKAPDAATNPVADKVMAVVAQLREAIKTGDTMLAERSMAENITIFEQGHAEKSRAEYISHHFREDVVFAKAVPSKVVSSQVQIDGAMALVTAYSTTDGTFKDRPIKNAGVETYVLRLRGDTWLIEHIHWSSSKRP